MKILSAALGQNGEDLWFFCPGCEHLHSIKIGVGPGPRWRWDGNAASPTITPSILVEFPATPDADEEHKEWRQKRLCHSFIRGGRIQFLGDCTHALAGQTVPLPPLPAYLDNFRGGA